MSILIVFYIARTATWTKKLVRQLWLSDSTRIGNETAAERASNIMYCKVSTGKTSRRFQHYASQQYSALEALGADVSYCLLLLTAETLILNSGQVCVCVCVCTLSDLIRLYLWWCLTPLRAWQLLPFLSLSAFIFLYSFSPSSLSSSCLCHLCLLSLSLWL